MRSLLLVFAFYGSTAFAVDLIYSCRGLWATPNAVLDVTATIKGSFNPNGSQIKVDLKTQLGGVLKGEFSGRDGRYSEGQFVHPSNNSGPIPGSLTRITSTDFLNDGFRFDGPGISAIFSCTR